ncbi:enamine deaminase RidA (YjgF/YER057c/UK114 family) [Granulicella aggregans]|uniref:Enamine deaminase RidA (YjgF/YER057c/UK114 family) n=1 Tax=Granulicella aggregans TaxID=474949 RepID=A0A7W7ZHM0_9BACT|nr:enamine deaminase RidA (YjgF/YER057c/UK114 family) [Granulicella aggregans]
MLERVITKPDPYEPFLLSQGIRVGELVFISGQDMTKVERSSRMAFGRRANRLSSICNAL